MNTKITVLSPFGFKTNMSSVWVPCDKVFLASNTFKNLKRGTYIDNIKFNKDNFVTSLSITGENLTPSKTVLDSEHTPHKPVMDSKSREILKGQCLNIVFRDSTLEILSFKDEMDRRIKMSQKLFERLEASNYSGW